MADSLHWRRPQYADFLLPVELWKQVPESATLMECRRHTDIHWEHWTAVYQVYSTQKVHGVGFDGPIVEFIRQIETRIVYATVPREVSDGR